MAKEYILNGIHFKTKKDVLDYNTKLRTKYNVNEIVSGEDFRYLIDLLKCRNDYDKVVGCGINYIYYGRSENQNGMSNCFIIQRWDGSKKEFTTGKYFDRDETAWSNLNKAARNTIKYQIDNFKKQFDYVNDNYEVHHDEIAFNELLKGFISTYQINYHELEYSSTDSIDCFFVDKVVEEQWKWYHQENAKLKLLTKQEHKLITYGIN